MKYLIFKTDFQFRKIRNSMIFKKLKISLLIFVEKFSRIVCVCGKCFPDRPKTPKTFSAKKNCHKKFLAEEIFSKL